MYICILDYSSPHDIKITENLLESSDATVEWSFPPNCTSLSQFGVILRKEDCRRVVDEVVAATDKRQAQIDGLKPSTKYSVSVVAEYRDGSLKQGSKEHETCGMCTNMDMCNNTAFILHAFRISVHTVTVYTYIAYITIVICVTQFSDYYKKDVIHFKIPFLPMVKKYFQFADTLDLSFLQPIEVITFTSEEKIVTIDKEEISICVPDNAVPIGRRLHMEVGSAMYGRLSFPENMRPVSPILWICPQEEMDLLKPLKITLPHTVQYEKCVTELFFLKACHDGKLPVTTSFNEMEVFNFEEMTKHKGIEFDERNGSVFTEQFCCVCIAENVCMPTNKSYLLHRTQPRKRNTQEFAVDYCITFNLSTCVQVRNLCQLVLKCMHR